MGKPIVDALYMMSAVIDVMDIQIPDVTGKTQDQVGAELIMHLVKKMHKAKKEINDLVQFLTDKDPSEMKLNEIIETVKEFLKQEGVLDFLGSFVK